MKSRISPFLPLLPLALATTLGACDSPSEPDPIEAGTLAAPAVVSTAASTSVRLGRALFFDKRLSLRQDQACASCHAPEFGFTGPVPGVNRRGAVYMGSVRYRSGNRKPPSAAYAAQAPGLHYDPAEDVWIGGNFWDGRATGFVVGTLEQPDPAADQAIGPFLNPAEQALPDAACVVWKAATGSYGGLLEEQLGFDPLEVIAFPTDIDRRCSEDGAVIDVGGTRDWVDIAYHGIGRAISAFEASPEVSAFSSKYDYYLRGEAELTPDELAGLELFDRPDKGNCAACHPSESENGEPPLFTDYTYDNLGVPANPLNPSYPAFVDYGLGGYLASVGDPGAESFMGAVKVPTLRNVARAPGETPKAYGHNGVFKSLEQIIHFYNTAATMRVCADGEVAPTPGGLARMGYEPECWPPPEVAENVNRDELGDLGLSDDEVRQIVTFLGTLSDGYTPGH